MLLYEIYTKTKLNNQPKNITKIWQVTSLVIQYDFNAVDIFNTEIVFRSIRIDNSVFAHYFIVVFYLSCEPTIIVQGSKFALADFIIIWTANLKVFPF